MGSRAAFGPNIWGDGIGDGIHWCFFFGKLRNTKSKNWAYAAYIQSH